MNKEQIMKCKVVSNGNAIYLVSGDTLIYVASTGKLETSKRTLYPIDEEEYSMMYDITDDVFRVLKQQLDKVSFPSGDIS